MRFHSTAYRVRTTSVFGLLLLVAALSACSSSSSTSSSAASSAATANTATSSAAAASPGASGSAAAIAEIKTNWVKFFSSSTSNSERVALLQNGSKFASAVAAFAANPLASTVSSKVDSVTLTSATAAKVKYDITAAGNAVIAGQTGTAVLQNGTWKVGDGSFCGLLRQGAAFLNVKVPAACSTAG